MKNLLKVAGSILLCTVFIFIYGNGIAEARMSDKSFLNSKVKNLKVVSQTATGIELKWDELKNTGELSNYTVVRSTSKKGKYKVLFTCEENSCCDDDVEAGQTYYYKVYKIRINDSCTEVIDTKTSNIVSATAEFDHPQMSVMADGNEAIIMLNQVAGADGYIIYMATGNDKEYKGIKTIKAGDKLTYTQEGLTEGDTYYFKYRVYNKVDKTKFWSDYSEVQSIQIRQKETTLQETPSNAFEYEINNGEVTITKLLDHDLEKVVIPKKIEGAPVTELGMYVFNPVGENEGYKVKEIVIQDNVTKISNMAFTSCHTVEKITLPKNLESMGSIEDDSDYAGMFKRCSSLKEINIPAGIKTIGVGTFEDCSNLETVIMPDSVEEIGERAFQSCTNLSSIKLSNKLTYIGEEAFSGSGLVEILLPKSLKEIAKGAFSGTTIKKVIIPGNVKIIGEDAFSNDYLKEVTLENGIKEIGAGAFPVEEITIPGSVTIFNACEDSSECDHAIKIILLDGVKMIRGYWYGKNLTIYIPASVTAIDLGDEVYGGYTVITPKGSYAEKFFTENSKYVSIVTE